MKSEVIKMERSFLKGLGLEKDIIDKIMNENGKDIEAEKSKITQLQTQLDAANKTIKERDTQLETLKNSPDNPETLRQQIQKLQDDNKAAKEAHEKEIKELKVSTALEKALSDAKAKNAKAVKALLDLGDDVELADDGTIKGLDDKIKGLKKSDAYLFDDTKPSTTIKGANPTNTNPNNPTDPGSKKPQEKSYEDFLAEVEAESNAN